MDVTGMLQRLISFEHQRVLSTAPTNLLGANVGLHEHTVVQIPNRIDFSLHAHENWQVSLLYESEFGWTDKMDSLFTGNSGVTSPFTTFVESNGLLTQQEIQYMRHDVADMRTRKQHMWQWGYDDYRLACFEQPGRYTTFPVLQLPKYLFGGFVEREMNRSAHVHALHVDADMLTIAVKDISFGRLFDDIVPRLLEVTGASNAPTFVCVAGVPRLIRDVVAAIEVRDHVYEKTVALPMARGLSDHEKDVFQDFASYHVDRHYQCTLEPDMAEALGLDCEQEYVGSFT